MRISEAFQKAMNQRVKQLKGQLQDNHGSYCATGWLIVNGFNTHGKKGIFQDWEHWLEDKYPIRTRGLRVVAYLNDERNWNWKMFRNNARRFEKIIDAKGAEKK